LKVNGGGCGEVPTAHVAETVVEWAELRACESYRLDLGYTSGTTNEYDLIPDVRNRNTRPSRRIPHIRILEDLFDRFYGRTEEIKVKLLELGTRKRLRDDYGQSMAPK
jgi:hypothetical protein